MIEFDGIAAPSGSLSRPLDRAEIFFWYLDRCSSMNFAVFAEGHGALDAASVEVALRRAQQIHPALAATIDVGQSGFLEFMPRPHAAIRVECITGGANWQAELVRWMVEPFELGAAPLMRARFINLPGQGWVFALNFHHAIADGRSGLRLVTEVIDAARRGESDEGTRRKGSSLMTLFPDEFAGASGEAKAHAWKAALQGAAVVLDPIPALRQASGPPRPGITVVSFDAVNTARLVERARHEGASVHGAIGAAELIAVRRGFGGDVLPTLRLTSPVDLRSRLAEPVDDATPGFYISLLSWEHMISAEPDLWALARSLTLNLRKQLDNGHGYLMYHLVGSMESMVPSDNAIAKFRKAMQRVPHECMLSNVGRVAALPEAYGVRLDKVSFALCPMANQAIFVAASTWDERLTLNIVHDASRFPEADCHAVASAMRELLMT